MDDLIKKAINAALSNDWEEAINKNLEIHEKNPQDVDTLNRLAFAYTRLCNPDEAKKIYKMILKIDKYNIIALKNLEKINSFPKNTKSKLPKKDSSIPFAPSLFIEEPGKTKSLALTNLAPPSVLSDICIGDNVLLNPKKHSLEVRLADNTYIGALPDDIAFRLLHLIKGKNSYEVHIKNVTKNNITVFIRELKRGKRFYSQPSFLIPHAERSHMGNSDIKHHHDEEDEDEEKKAQDEGAE